MRKSQTSLAYRVCEKLQHFDWCHAGLSLHELLIINENVGPLPV